MDGILDDALLDGLRDVTICYRPERVGRLLSATSSDGFLDAVSQECHLWGGGGTPLIPVYANGGIPVEYRNMLAGAMLDRVQGMEGYGLNNFPHREPAIDLSAGIGETGLQLAITLLEYKKQNDYLTLEVVELGEGDIWRHIYAACLGLLPSVIDDTLLRAADIQSDINFEDFVRVRRLTRQGSLDDLVVRLCDRKVLTPRQLSMIELQYGNEGNTSLRDAAKVLPGEKFAMFDGGPNVVVVCSENCVEDVALLWNLRGAHGDARPLPIGIPSSLLSSDVADRLAMMSEICHHGRAVHNIYLTSASLSTDDLRDIVGVSEQRLYGVASYRDMITFGMAPGWYRNEVLAWSGGHSRFVPLQPDAQRELIERRGVHPRGRMVFDLSVADRPFPAGDDVRVHTLTHEFRAGCASNWGTIANRSEVREVVWPSSLLMARSIAARRGIDLRESEPGRSARVALQDFNGLWELDLLAHAPLLALLERMANRQGVNYFKSRARGEAETIKPSELVGDSVDELREVSFNEFKDKAFGNNSAAAKRWLVWAEKRSLIVKGFSLRCSACQAKQWMPVASFSPPIICRGCAGEMKQPFEDQAVVHFGYRLSERLRRLYSHDAMGHLLAMRYFYYLLFQRFGGRAIGMHPGMEIVPTGQKSVASEVDVLILMRNSELIPVEVKRSFGGITEDVCASLRATAESMGSGWSVVVACEYTKDIELDVGSFVERGSDGAYTRVVLTYDHLLDRMPMWHLGGDPFRPFVLTENQVAEREKEYIARLVDHLGTDFMNTLGDEMLSTPKLRSQGEQ